ncbi:MBL fold metallo-hydrolase [Streptomyces sp. NPDC051677]|uniref:MBL fold metallo-hydrolase n=1 Tax=Streptomyces sp. NPDC051677 TaxID=3365669 RepID=UPI0037CF72F7
MTGKNDLRYAVHVAPPIPTTMPDVPPGTGQLMWSPISSTLVYGERDAVLVDPVMTAQQAAALADWVESFDRNLTTIYVTHGHGDHWFGLATLLERFPNARPVATPTVAENMVKQMDPGFLDNFWRALFPGQIADRLVAAEPLEGTALELEDRELTIVPLGHTDTDDTTALHVPSIGLVVAGDAAYNDVHLYLAESPREGRAAWKEAIDVIAGLDPAHVVAGHKRADRPDSPDILAETRGYLDDFEECVESTGSTEELYQAMLKIHPDRVNPGVLWGSARSAKG